MNKILKRTMISILHGVMIYVLTFVVITRWSLHMDSINMIENTYFFAPPFNCVEIANSPRLQSVHFFLASMFNPLAFFDYHLTGCYIGNLPLIKLTGEPEATSE